MISWTVVVSREMLDFASSAPTAQLAALGHELKLPMADSIILATARRYDATVWTQDANFAEIKGVKYFSKQTEKS